MKTLIEILVPSPPMPKAKRDTSSPWYSTPNAARKSPAVRFTLDPEALAALAYLEARHGNRSAIVRDALVEKAKREGWSGTVADHGQDHGQ